MWRSAGALMAVCLCALAGAPAADLSTDQHIVNPRAYGHFIGDPIDRSIELTIPPGYTLAPESLPLPQRQGAWLELQSVRPQSNVTARGRRVRIDLHYQLVNSPTIIERTALPGMTLHFVGGAESFDTIVDDFPIVLSPLARGTSDPSLMAMRPSRAPVQIDGTRWEWLLAVATAAAVLFMAAASARPLVAFMQGRGTGPFGRAQRTLHELRLTAPGVEQHRAALLAVHRAFDETAGVPVFAERLDAFFEAHPAFAALRAPVRAFYAESRGEFFGGGNGMDDTLRIERLLSLCSQLRTCERRTRA